jgi:hypothetical protein
MNWKELGRKQFWNFLRRDSGNFRTASVWAEIQTQHLPKGAHTGLIMLHKIVLRNTSLPIHDQVNQHHT